MIAEIIINSNVKTLNKTFDYNVPKDMQELVSIGKRVLVQFGRGKKVEEGFVISLKDKSEFKTKDILKVEEGFCLDKQNVELAKMMARRYFCNISDCIKLMLPPGTTSKKMENRVKDKTRQYCYLLKDEEEIADDINSKKLKSEKQIKVLNFMLDNDNILKQDLEYFTDTSSAVIKTLEKNGYIEILEKKVDRNPFINKKLEKTKNLKLTEEQQIAFNKVKNAIDKKQFEEFLLYGITGSRQDRGIFTINKRKFKKRKNSYSSCTRNFINTTNGR